MFVIEYKVKGSQNQYRAIDEAIRAGQFVRNKALRFWMDGKKVNKYDLNKYCRILAKEFDFARHLNSTARQSSAERAWSAITRFYDNCKKQVPGKKAERPLEGSLRVRTHQAGYPKFKNILVLLNTNNRDGG